MPKKPHEPLPLNPEALKAEVNLLKKLVRAALDKPLRYKGEKRYFVAKGFSGAAIAVVIDELESQGWRVRRGEIRNSHFYFLERDDN